MLTPTGLGPRTVGGINAVMGKRGLGGGREATIGFAAKADIYFAADGDYYG